MKQQPIKKERNLFILFWVLFIDGAWNWAGKWN